MNTRTHALHARAGSWPHTLSVVVAHLGAVPGLVVAYLAAASRRAARRRAMQAMSDATLRDLGLHRSEVDSCWAESEGVAPVSRLRLIHGPWR